MFFCYLELNTYHLTHFKKLFLNNIISWLTFFVSSFCYLITCHINHFFIKPDILFTLQCSVVFAEKETCSSWLILLHVFCSNTPDRVAWHMTVYQLLPQFWVLLTQHLLFLVFLYYCVLWFRFWSSIVLSDHYYHYYRVGVGLV